MPLPFFLAGVLGKTVIGIALKGGVGKAGAAAAKGLFGKGLLGHCGHPAQHGFARRLGRRLAEQAVEDEVRSALERRRARKASR